jgi:hypothetical protein
MVEGRTGEYAACHSAAMLVPSHVAGGDDPGGVTTVAGGRGTGGRR